jgi:c-di-GMP-binding flagellar brake protein YcgR
VQKGKKMAKDSFNGKERRAYVRLNKALTVRLKFSGDQPDKTYTANTKDISHGGLCLEVPKNQKELIEKLSATSDNSSINVEASILNTNLKFSVKPAWISCKLDWAKKPTNKNQVMLTGLTFHNLTDDTRKQIHDYIVEEFVMRYDKAV